MMHATKGIGLALLVGVFALTSLGAPAVAAAQSAAKKAKPDQGKVHVPNKGQKTSAFRLAKGQKGAIHAPAAVKQKAGKLALAGATEKRGKTKTEWVNLVMFFLLAFGCLGFAVVMITRKSPMMSALSLLVVFLCLAGIYVFLKAPFMAAIQLIVYAGAVIVLFVFVIMSMGLKDAYGLGGMSKDLKYLGAGFIASGAAAFFFFYVPTLGGMVVAGMLWAATLAVFMVFGVPHPFTRFAGIAGASFATGQILRLATLTKTYLAVPETGKTKMAVASPLGDNFGSAQDVGMSVFQQNVFAFEALSLLLLAAIVAAVVIVRSRKEAS